MIKKITLIIISLLVASASFATKFVIEAPKVVTVGERFRVGFKIDATPENFIAPSFDGVILLAGPTTSSFSSISWVNGTKTEVKTFTYTYVLEATTEGILNIPPAEVTVAGTSYKTAVYPIEVIKENAQLGQSQGSQGGQSQPQGGQTQQPQTQTSQSNANDIFMRIEFNKTNLYKGESLVASLKLYTRVGVSDLINFKAPTFAGFYSQELDVPASESGFKRQNVNNKIYNVAVLKRWLFFPQRSGAIKIDPAELVAQVQVQRTAQQGRSIFDDFFGSPMDLVNKDLKSPAVTINIKDLPGGAPASFAGAVGTFNMDAKFDKTEVMANEALGYTLTISGTGNLKLVEEPTINFPTDFEKYDPKTSEKISSTIGGTTGSKKFEYAIIPRSHGEFDVPGVKFSYFNPSTGKYVELNSGDTKIIVEKDPNATTSVNPTGPVMQGPLQQDIRHLGTDILFIKTTPLSLQPVGYLFFGSSTFWLILLGLALLFVVTYFVMQNMQKTRGNVALMRNKRANKVAKKRLKQSEKLMKEGNKQGFYEELSKAMWGYVSDKLNIPLSDLSKNNVQEKLQSLGVDSDTIKELISVIDECEYARYAPDSKGGLEGLYGKAIDIISKVER